MVHPAIVVDTSVDPVDREYVPLELLLAEHTEKELLERRLQRPCNKRKNKRNRRPRENLSAYSLSVSDSAPTSSSISSSTSSSTSALVGRFFKKHAQSLFELRNANNGGSAASGLVMGADSFDSSSTSTSANNKPFDEQFEEEANKYQTSQRLIRQTQQATATSPVGTSSRYLDPF